MDMKYQHTSIQLFIMRLKPSAATLGTPETSAFQVNSKTNETGNGESGNSEDKNFSGCSQIDESDELVMDKVKEDSLQMRGPQRDKLNEWEARRYGSLAARLLRDVKIT